MTACAKRFTLTTSEHDVPRLAYVRPPEGEGRPHSPGLNTRSVDGGWDKGAAPQLDEFFLGHEREQALREKDFAALGCDENAIWR